MRIVMRLIIAACVLAMTFAGGAVEKDKQTFILCGRQLAKARELICAADMYKRSSIPFTLPDFLNEERSNEDRGNEIDWPWSGRRGALAANWSRYKRGGLADECCLKSCTYDTIRSYC